MIDFHVVLTASLVCLAGVMSPGPNFVAVTHRAVTAPRSEALALVAGIACVSVLWSGSALFGLGLLFALFPWLFWAVKLLGATYLVWFGIQLLRQARQPLAAGSAPAAQTCRWRAFRQGLLTNLSNPKAMMFYASVFSAAVPAGATPATLAVIVGAVGTIAASWYGSVALFLSGAHANRLYRRGKPLIEATCGVFLIGYGVRQALVRP
jgi:threonine efflux protein